MYEITKYEVWLSMKKTNTEITLKDLIAPITEKEFLDHYFERKFLLNKGKNLKNFSNLLTLDDIETLVSSTLESSSQWIRLVKDKVEQPLSNYSLCDKRTSVNRILSAYGNGTTLVLNALQKRWPPIDKLGTSLKSAIPAAFGANMYLTPAANSQGFGAHFDDHCVFILQLHGSKHWNIYHQYMNVPTSNEKKGKLDEKELKKPKHSFVMEPGDVMYIPRGLIHEALTTDEYSCHLTVGIYPPTWDKLFMRVLNKNDDFRRAIPFQLLKEKGGKQKLQKIYEGMCKKASDKMHRHKETFNENSYIPGSGIFSHGGFESINNKTKIKKTTQFEKRFSSELHIEKVGDQICLKFPDNMFLGPISLTPLLRHMEKHKQFSIEDLPDVIDARVKRKLIRDLLDNGFLRFVKNLDPT